MPKKRYRAQIIGATGYGGLGMLEQLLRHPEIEISTLLAKTDIGKPISNFFPHLRGFCDQVVEEIQDDRVGVDADVVIFATPDRVAMRYAPDLLKRGVRVIDYRNIRLKAHTVHGWDERRTCGSPPLEHPC